MTDLTQQAMSDFELAMVEAGHHKPERSKLPGGQYLYQRDQDRFVGFTLRTPDAGGRDAAMSEPDPALLVSMATCLNHGFGLLPMGEQQRLLQNMRKLWDEVMGRGYYSPERSAWYLSMLNPAQPQEAAIAQREGS